MQWRQDLLEDGGRIWTDYVCERWRCEQGHSVKENEAWALLLIEPGGHKRWVSDHPTLSKAKAAAKAAMEPQNNS